MSDHSALTQRLIAEGCSPRAAKAPADVRYDAHGPMRLMARAEGYVMARRPGCTPRVLSEAQWAALPTTKPGVAA